MIENKGDLISREALKEHKFLSPGNPNATRFYNETTKAYQKGWNDCIDAIIDNAPAVEERPQGEITEEDIQNAIKAGYENGYSMAQAKYQRPHGECENCDYYKFSNAVCSGIVDEMVKLGIDNVDDLLKFLRGKEE